MFRLLISLLVISLLATLGLAQSVSAQIDSRTERQMAKVFTEAMSDNLYLDSLTRGDADHAMNCMASVLILTSLIYQNREQALRFSEQLTEARTQNVFWHWKHEYEQTADAQVEPAALYAAVSRRNAAMVGQPEGMTSEMRHLGECWVRPAWLMVPDNRPMLRNVMAGLQFIPREYAVAENRRKELEVIPTVQMSNPADFVIRKDIKPENDSDEAYQAYLNAPYSRGEWLDAMETIRNECLSNNLSFIEAIGKNVGDDAKTCTDKETCDWAMRPSDTLQPILYTVVCEKIP